MSLEHEYISQTHSSQKSTNCFILPALKSWQLAYTLKEWPQLQYKDQGMDRQNTKY